MFIRDVAKKTSTRSLINLAGSVGLCTFKLCLKYMYFCSVEISASDITSLKMTSLCSQYKLVDINKCKAITVLYTT